MLPSGITIGALVAVNPLGAVTVSQSRHFWAAPFEIGDEFGGLGLPVPFPADAQAVRLKFRNAFQAGTNTTIAVIASDAVMTKAAVKRLAISAHDGFSRAIWPAHTPHDGDLVFALATGTSGQTVDPAEELDFHAAAAATMARAIARGVYLASSFEDDIMPAWQNAYGG